MVENARQRLIVVSNRVPPASDFHSEVRGEAAAGGLVTAVRAAMDERGGMWFGWSGRSTRRRGRSTPTITDFGDTKLATIDLSDDEVSLYYSGYANRTLWAAAAQLSRARGRPAGHLSRVSPHQSPLCPSAAAVAGRGRSCVGSGLSPVPCGL